MEQIQMLYDYLTELEKIFDPESLLHCQMLLYLLHAYETKMDQAKDYRFKERALTLIAAIKPEKVIKPQDNDCINGTCQTLVNTDEEPHLQKNFMDAIPWGVRTLFFK